MLNKHSAPRGQGLIEYLGAMLIAGMLAVMLTNQVENSGFVQTLFAQAGKILLMPVVHTTVEDDDVVVIAG